MESKTINGDPRLMTTLVEEVSPPPPPDLTNFIVKCSNQYSNGGSFGDVYRCWYDCGADAPKEVWITMHAIRPLAFNSISGCGESFQVQIRKRK